MGLYNNETVASAWLPVQSWAISKASPKSPFLSSEVLKPESPTTSISIGSVSSELSLTPPQLDSDDDISLISVARPSCSPKVRLTRQVQFATCTDDHPLNPTSNDTDEYRLGADDVLGMPSAASSHARRSLRRTSHFSVNSTSASPYSLHTTRSRFSPPRSPQSSQASHEDSINIVMSEMHLGPEKEMKMYFFAERSLVGHSDKRRCRPNSEYLRMYAGERQLLLNQKIPTIPTRSVLPPRADYIHPSGTEKFIGIHGGWQKVRTRRAWRQLTAEDFQ